MKNLCIFPVLFIYVSTCFGQLTGSIGYQMILEVNKNKVEHTRLIFDGHHSIFTLTDMDKKVTISDGEFSLSGEDELASELTLNFSFGPDYYLPYIYTNLLEKQILSKEYLAYKGETTCFITYEETNGISWILSNETKTLGSFQCQKATTSFRGRNYTVWFTLEIPVPIGPWKLNGLPGLILEAYDEEMGVQFLYNSAEIPYTGNIKLLPPEGGQLISIFEYADIESNRQVELTRAIESKLPRGATITLNPVGKSPSIEREFKF